MAQIKHLADGTIYTVQNNPVWINGVWECGDQRFADPQENQYQVIATNYTSKLVSIGIFLASLTSQERSALRAHPDPLIKEFVTIMTDPRITEIDLNLPVTQFDINYAAGLVPAPVGAANAGVLVTNPPIGGAARASAILSGNPLVATN